MRKKISKRERAVLTLSVAQKMVGKDKTPSARDVRRAHKFAGKAVSSAGVSVMGGEAPVNRFVNNVCERLSGIRGDDASSCGSFWSAVKDAATKVATTISPITPYLGPTAQIAMLAAKPIASKLTSPTVARRAPEKDDDESLASVVGELQRLPGDITYIFGDDETLIEGAGGPELAAARRRHGGRRRHASISGAVPHELYRASIVQRARRLAGGATPGARHMMVAEASVKHDLAMNNLGVSIPGARPGRVTQ